MAARPHLGPPADVVHPLRPRARRAHDLLGERGVGRRHLDASAVRHRPRGVEARVVGPEGRVDGAGHPVDHHVGEQLVLGEAPLHLPVAVAPAPELLHDPRGQPRRGVAEPEGEGLRPRALDPLIARLLPLEAREVGEVLLLLGSGIGRRLDVAAEREQVDVDADEPLRISKRQSGGDEAAPVAALRAPALVAQHVGHQRGERVGHLDDPEARLARGVGETVAGQRRRDHRERIGGVAAEARGIGEHGDDLVELPHRARPPVGDQERQRPGAAALLVDEMEVDAGHLRDELAERVEPGLVRAPVVAVLPVGDELLHVGEAGAIGPLLPGSLIRPAHAGQPLAQVGERRLRDVDAKGVRRHQNTGRST